MADTKPRVKQGSGNVFADLGRPHADELQFKARLTQLLADCVDQRGLTDQQAASVLGLTEHEAISLFEGRKLNEYPAERLLKWLGLVEDGITVSLRSSTSDNLLDEFSFLP
jgi:predicted XRE-type DNA-binding protein